MASLFSFVDVERVVEWNIPCYLGDSSGVEKGMDVVFDGRPGVKVAW